MQHILRRERENRVTREGKGEKSFRALFPIPDGCPLPRLCTLSTVGWNPLDVCGREGAPAGGTCA